jgi:signal transduction histidine kinase
VSTTTTAELPDDRTPPERRIPDRLLELARRMPGDVAYLLLGLPLGIAFFTFEVAAVSTGGGLLITLIGFPILLLTVLINRGLANIERQRASLVLGEPIPSRYKVAESGSIWARLKAIAADPATWKDGIWMVLMLPLGILGFVVAVTTWCVVLGLLTQPFWWKAATHHSGHIDIVFFSIHSWAGSILAFLLGALLVIPAAALCRGAASTLVSAAKALLSPAEVVRRVDELTASRAGAVDAQAAELRRIERDLHDGAQARLVALAMDLGLAREKLASADTTAAAGLVAEAHDEAKRALVELRDLARGIHPAVLTDRGLAAALPALAGRCAVPVALDVELRDRLPAPIEAAAYFVVAEALTNVSKHSGASHAEVRVRRLGDRVIVEVWDDGTGGADSHGSGLAGLAGRVGAFDGRLSVDSPKGGPTLLRAELPLDR